MAETPHPHTPPPRRTSAPAFAHAAEYPGSAIAPLTQMNLARGRLSLIKGEHRWRFRWEQGGEAAIISAVADLARDPNMNFDWYDAAVVCRHIAQGLPSRGAVSATSAPSREHREEK